MVKPHSPTTVQLKMNLAGFRPPIWRRLLVPDSFDLGRLHRLIQIAFGWADYHLHVFQIRGEEFGEPDPEGWVEYRSERITLKKLDLQPKETFEYEYDLGDSWIHRLTVEKIFTRDEPLVVPVCLAGKRACPPEDSGGPDGFQAMLHAARDPNHPDHEEFKEYLNPGWDAEAFDLDAINASFQAAFAPRKRRAPKRP